MYQSESMIFETNQTETKSKFVIMVIFTVYFSKKITYFLAVWL